MGDDHDDDLARSIRMSGLQRLAKVFHDISTRAHFFRSKLLEEFQLTDSITDSKIVQTPIYASHDIADKEIRATIMENPYTLIKFKLFKRMLSEDEANLIDRRLTRTKNQGSLPIGAWAAWVVKHDIFQNFMVFLIFLNCIVFAVDIELKSNEKDHYYALQVLEMIETLSLFVFIIEVGLKWIDNFRAYFSDGWEVFDFTLLSLSLVPTILQFVNRGMSSDLQQITGQLRVLRVLRTFKIVLRFSSLKIIVITIIGTMKSMAVILILLFITAYIFAILGVSLFNPTSYPANIEVKSLKEYYNRWTNVGEALKTLFQIFTHDKWIYIMYELSMIVNPTVAYIYVLLWVWVGGFIFRNIFIGVLVSNFEKISVKVSERQAEMDKVRKYQQLKKILNKELNAQENIQNRDLTDAETALVANNTMKLFEEDDESANPKAAIMGYQDLGDVFGLGQNDGNKNESIPKINFQFPNVPEDSIGDGNNLPEVGQEISDEPKISFIPNKEEEIVEKDDEDDDGENEEDAAAQVIQKIGDLLALSDGVSRDWENTVTETLNALAKCDRNDTYWPRDTIFAYFRTMEALQENLKEFEELQNLAVSALLDLHDD